VTTALGLLTLATSHIVAVRDFGIGAALGVTVDMAVSIVLVPTLLARVQPDRRMPALELFLIDALRKTAGFATSRPVIVTAGAAVIGVAAMLGIGRLRVDTNHIAFFPPSHPLSESARVIDRELGGVYNFHVFLEGAPDSLTDPGVLQRIDRLSTSLAGLPDVRTVVSLAAYVKRTHQTLQDGSPAPAVIPGDAAVIAQELFLFTLNDEGRRELERVAAGDFSRGTIVVRLPAMGSDLVFERIQAADALAATAFAGSAVTATVTGSGRLHSTLDHHLVQSQISSFGTAFVAVFAAFVVMLRSVRLGVVALVPNLFPVLIVLGTMGWLGISLNVATVMVASVALGVVDDDTVHFMHRFRHQREAGDTVDEAVALAAVIEGRAAATIALVTSCGFAVLMLSEYRPSAWFGGLLALTMIVALITEILVLPAVLKLVARSHTMRLSPARSE
jgi:predicted RND superfamily exporter protein